MRKAIFLSICFLLSIFAPRSGAAQPITTPYNYPVRPGNPEWASLVGIVAQRKACQIPYDVLQNMTTEALVETCLDYPLFLEYPAFSDSLGGMQTVISGFNGLQELLQRKDAGPLLIKRYSRCEPRGYDHGWPSWKIGEFSAQISGLELLLAHRSIQENLSPSQHRDLLALAVDISRKKLQDKAYGLLSVGRSARLACLVMLGEQDEAFRAAMAANQRLAKFVSTADSGDPEEINETLSHADNFLKNK